MNNKIPSVELSVSLIASNEEKNIGRCLDSVRSIADEIVVVHNDCSDKTVEIAESYGAKCFEQKWQGYKDQKNISLGKATKSWVLCLDADEVVSPELLSSIKEFIKQGPEQGVDGYAFNRLSFFLGKWIKHGDWYPDRKLRLIKNGEATWTGAQVHEVLRANGSVERMKGDLLHFSYPSMSSFIEKTISFSDLYLQRQLETKRKWRLPDVLFRPIWRFARGYIIRLGFLDGFPGFFIAVATAFSTFFKHSRLYESSHTDPHGESKKEPPGDSLD
jgi:glycosyltransferase involved in cell wall biosynthesis